MSYDTTLQMFTEKPRELNPDILKFWRWLAERGQLEHEVAGPVSAEIADQIKAKAIGPVYTGKA